MSRAHSSLIAVAVLAIVACAKPADAPPPPAPGSGQVILAPGGGPLNPILEAGTYAPTLQVDLKGSTKSASGLYFRDLVVGTGAEAVVGKQVTAKYDGTLADGTPVDAGIHPFILGARAVIPGWDEGLVGMKVGGKRQLIIPSDLGYGPNGRQPRVPGNSILVFMVELVAVQ